MEFVLGELIMECLKAEGYGGTHGKTNAEAGYWNSGQDQDGLRLLV